MIYNLSENNSLVSQYVAELRDVSIQTNRMRFRRNMERLGEIAAYEISKKLFYRPTSVTTPLGVASSHLLAEQPVLATILRAGLPLHQGLLNYFDNADCAFIAAYRAHQEEDKHGARPFEIEVHYLSCAKLENRILIVSDPMLATGSSMVLSLKKLYSYGKPKQTHVVSAVACTAGIDKIRQNLPDVTIWTAAIDKELNKKSYIVPGLGDAGDLAFGAKLQGEE